MKKWSSIQFWVVSYQCWIVLCCTRNFHGQPLTSLANQLNIHLCSWNIFEKVDLCPCLATPTPRWKEVQKTFGRILVTSKNEHSHSFLYIWLTLCPSSVWSKYGHFGYKFNYQYLKNIKKKQHVKLVNTIS